MIAVGSIGKLLVSEGSGAYTFFNTFGNTVLALFCGIIAVGMLIFGRKKKVVDKANVDGNGCKVSEKSSWFEIVMNNWVGRALNIAISALLITAMGGAMGGILRENEAIQTIGAGNAGVVDAATIAEERRYMDFTKFMVYQTCHYYLLVERGLMERLLWSVTTRG